jgi:hypothetical protein
MSTIQVPPSGHVAFDALCAEVEEFEPLPTVTAAPEEMAARAEDEQETAPLDGLILAGLVSP